MAIDKAIDSAQLNANLSAAANAIRTKGGTSEELLFPAGFITAIENIPLGGVTTETIDVTIDNISTSYIDVPVTSATYDNIIISIAMIESGVYSGGVLTVDDVPTAPHNSNGVDFYGVAVRQANGLRFSGLAPASNGTTQNLTNVYEAAKAGISGRINQTQQGGGVVAAVTYNSVGLKISGNTISIGAVRYWCQQGYRFKFRCKCYFWND